MLLRTHCRSSGVKECFSKIYIIIVSFLVFSIQLSAQNGWTKITSLPTPRWGASAEVVNNKIYVIGGFNDNENLAANEMYDPITDTWEQKAPMPTPRGYHATAVVNDTIYAMGGLANNFLVTVEAYDPITNTWTKKKNMLQNRIEFRAGVVNKIIYCIGGGIVGTLKC